MTRHRSACGKHDVFPTCKRRQVVCDLIEEEAELLGGSEHVLLGGFSQGGALALHIAVHSGIQ
jgi:predicted esterase